jgi:hypothetical protein
LHLANPAIECGAAPTRLFAFQFLLNAQWAKVKNPNALAVKREAEEDWGRLYGAMLLLVDKDEAHATQSRFCLAAPVARPTFPFGFGAALQPTIPISSHLLCK